ncbi:MAG: hypothetical protein Q9227_006940 [Pyrenula ochraceoflavens]
MASTTTTTSTASNSPRSHTINPTTLPISLLPDPLAKRYSYCHGPLVLSFYLIRFRSLVADPVATMGSNLPYVALLQLLFCVLSLVPAGASPGGEKGERNTKGGLKRKIPGAAKNGKEQASSFDLSNKLVPSFLAIILSLLLPPIPLTIIAILMGAPVTTHLPHTALLATHLSLLITVPLFYTHGVSSSAWYEISCLYLPFDPAGAWGGSIGALIGAWLGAIPIPLDWDREWQKWPVTVLMGAVGGWCVGKMVLGVWIFRGRRLEMDEVGEEEWHLVEDVKPKMQ